MDRLLPTVIIVLVIVVALSLMAHGWGTRRRRQVGISRPLPAPDSLGAATLDVNCWYVATTKANEPLERIAVHGLGFPAQVTASVHPEGLVLVVRGRAPFLIEPRALRGCGRATWAIDRVVERDGLVLVGWLLGDDPVDTYLRLPDPSEATAIVAAVQGLTPAQAVDSSPLSEPHRPLDSAEGTAL